MAHELETGLFVGQPAWHGLGVLVKEVPSLEDAIVMAGLDWKVALEPLQLVSDGRAVRSQAVIRQSDKRILGEVGPGWHPLQNSEAFAWFQPFVDEGIVTLEAAGALKGGQRVWVLAKVVGGEADIAKGDPIEQYVLLAHGHGGLAIRAGFTTVRVVCQNTLTAALESEASKLIKIHHHKQCLKALNEVREIMMVARGEFEATTEQLRRLARVGCDQKTLERYVREVFSPGNGEVEGAAKIILPKVVPLFEGGRGADLSRGTLWGAYNAVTEFVTHDRGRTQEGRLDGQWFGQGAKIISRALEVGLQLAA